jgi:hypothetical protein
VTPADEQPARRCGCVEGPDCVHESVAEQRLAEAILGSRVGEPPAADEPVDELPADTLDRMIADMPAELRDELREFLAGMPADMRADLAETLALVPPDTRQQALAVALAADQAGPSLTDLTDDLLPDERDRVLASVHVVERSGGREHQLGADDAGRWWASAHFKGTRIIVEGYADPANAADALVRRLLHRAACKCGRVVTLLPRPNACLWRREGPRWVAGCNAPPIHVDGPRGDLGAMLGAFNARPRPEYVEVPVAQHDRKRPRRGKRK